MKSLPRSIHKVSNLNSEQTQYWAKKASNKCWFSTIILSSWADEISQRSECSCNILTKTSDSVTSSSLLFVCLFCDISNGAFDRVFKLQVIFMKSAWINKREIMEPKMSWFWGINFYCILQSSIIGCTHALNYLLPLFFTFYSVLNVENMQSGM